MNAKVTIALLGSIALTSALAGCGSQITTESGHHHKHVKHHAQADPTSGDPSASASPSTSPSVSSQPSGPHDYSSWPSAVPAGPPKKAQGFKGVISGASGGNAPPPSGGLAAVNGRAAPWAIGQGGALVLFINPANPSDAWDMKYDWVPAAKQYNTSLDLVDIVPVSNGMVGVAKSAGTPPTNPSAYPTASQIAPGGQYFANSKQTLPQMATTMRDAAKAWGLPSWVHLYEISPQTAAAWNLKYGSAAESGSAEQSDPTLWVFAPAFSGDNYVPELSEGIPGATMSPVQAMQAVKQTIGNIP